MSRFVPGLLLCTLLAAPTILSGASPRSASDHSMWTRPDVTRYDARGTLVYGRFHDPAGRTVDVFQNGSWQRRFYSESGERLLSIVAPDSREEFDYDDTGDIITHTVSTYGQLFAVQAGPNSIVADGLPSLTLARDPQGRLLDIVGAKGRLVSYRYDAGGRVKSVALSHGSATIDLTFERVGEGRVRETLWRKKKALASATLHRPYGDRRPLLVNLDLLQERLALPDDWRRDAKCSWNSTRTIATLSTMAGVPFVRVLRDGPVSVGFDPSGLPLFYDIDVTPDVLSSSAAGYVPTRVIVTADERVLVEAPQAPDGAIHSVWFQEKGSGKKAAFRKLERVTTDTPGRISPQMMYECDSSTVCSEVEYQMPGGTTTTVITCHTTIYLCWAPDPGGEVCKLCGDDDGDGDGGGGGGDGGGDPANISIRNGVLHDAVADALNAALQKMENLQCQSVFQKWKNAPSEAYPGPYQTTAWDNLNGQSISSWVSGLSFFNGSTWSTCSNSVKMAFTTMPGSHVVMVCPQFSSYESGTPGQAADTIIHEILHTLGLGENPPNESQPTPTEIQDAVEDACGI